MLMPIQEDSEVWIGNFDKDKLEFTSKGAHYHFPRSDYCEQIYCNVEGVPHHAFSTPPYDTPPDIAPWRPPDPTSTSVTLRIWC